MTIHHLNPTEMVGSPPQAAMALGALAACGLVERKRTARKAQAEGPVAPFPGFHVSIWNPFATRCLAIGMIYNELYVCVYIYIYTHFIFISFSLQQLSLMTGFRIPNDFQQCCGNTKLCG